MSKQQSEFHESILKILTKIGLFLLSSSEKLFLRKFVCFFIFREKSKPKSKKLMKLSGIFRLLGLFEGWRYLVFLKCIWKVEILRISKYGRKRVNRKLESKKRKKCWYLWLQVPIFGIHSFFYCNWKKSQRCSQSSYSAFIPLIKNYWRQKGFSS